MSEPTEPAPADDHIVVADLADELQVWKQTIFKIAKRLDIRLSRRRDSSRGNQLVATITPADAAAIKSEISGSARSNQNGLLPRAPYATEDGVFYLIHLEPEHDPGRFKVGFTTDVDGRLRKHRCSAPFAVCAKSWPCRRTWEKTAIDCITDGLEQIHTEVFRSDALDDVVCRGDRFFEMMPAVAGAPDTEHEEVLFSEDAG